MANSQNIIGPQVRKLRYERDLKQEDLAARCGVLGWDLSRSTLSKIEAQLRCVTDFEVDILARALRVDLVALYPAKRSGRNAPPR